MTASAPSLVDRAEVDTMGLFLAHWRGTFIALIAITAGVTFAWHDLVPWRINAAWCAAAGLAYLGQIVASLKMERSPSLGSALPRWMPLLLASLAFSATTWGLAPLMLSSGGHWPVLAASLLNVLISFCVANAPGTPAMLWCALPPVSVLTISTLVWQDGLRYEGLTAAVLFGTILLYGLRIQSSLREAMVQRHVAHDLAEELRTNQQRLLELEGERAAQQEREQLMRSMHDGLGATLVSSLVLAERGQLDAREVADVLRECVDDVRLVVDSLEFAEHDLGTLLGSLRYRWDRRLQAAGLTLRWQVDDLPPSSRLTPAAALQVQRIVQEALANVVKHAQARELAISAQVSPTGVRVAICDDGIGFDPGAVATQGRGLRNLRQRSDQLGARLTLESRPGQGTRVCLDLPGAAGT